MSLVTTRAIVLHTFPYGESSKIVRLATRDHGVMSAVAKGAHRPRTRFGARIQPLSEGDVAVYVKRNRDLQTLAEFEVIRQRNELAHDVSRFAAAAALAELMLRCSPAEPNPELFAIFQGALDWLVDAETAEVESVALAGLWGTVVGLGFAPSTGVCAVDGRPLDAGVGRFSVPDGGLLCQRCGSSRLTSDLPVEDRAALSEFLAGRLPGPALDARHLSAHRRLISRFIRQHLAEDRDLTALDFWEERN